MNKLVYRLVTMLALVSIVAGGGAGAAYTPTWENKVDGWVLETAEGGETEFLVYLTEQADLSAVKPLTTKLEKGWFVYQRLTSVARDTQAELVAALERMGVDYRPYWIANMIWVRGGMEVIQRLAERPDVAHVYANPSVKLEEPTKDGLIEATPQTIEWNIIKAGAPEVWALGYTGQGVVIGGQDTGYDWDHPALINQYRGGLNEHDYYWHDSIHENDAHTSPGNPCGFDSAEPCDDSGHGTHTMGTMVGADGGSNQIGMAPGARWIGCRNMEEGWGKPSTYAECFEWFVAPYPVGGTPAQGDPAMAPDVISNSWGCPAEEGCTDPTMLLTVVQNLVAAGIVTAHSAGNSGSGCYTVNTPAGIYAESFTVGATNSSDTIAGFSSRGPVTVDGSNRPKPDISAPGVSIRSSVPGGGYESGWSGTSMAAPHVAGLVALMISAYPELGGEVDLIRQAIEQSAVHIAWTGCNSSGVPNNAYGWGRIDALTAVEYFYLGLEKSASAETVIAGDNITYTLSVSHPHGAAADTNILLSDTLPEGTTFISATQPYTLTGNTILWQFPALEVSGTVSAELVVQVDEQSSGVITNQDYWVTSDQSGTVVGEPVSTIVEGLAALSLDKSTSAGLAFAGDLITYTLEVENVSEAVAATNVVLTDTVPIDTEFVWATTPYTQTGESIRWDFVSLGALNSVEVQLVVRVMAGAAGEVTNRDYAAWADQAEAVRGEPVVTQVGWVVFMPVMVGNR